MVELNDRWMHERTDRQTDRQTGKKLVGYLVGCLVGWYTWLVGSLVGRLIYFKHGRSARSRLQNESTKAISEC